MSYNFISNIPDFSTITNGNLAYTSIQKKEKIKFIDKNNVQHQATFLMIRAGEGTDLLIELQPSSYCIYIPGGEMWSVDSIGEIESIIIQNIFNSKNKTEITNGPGYIQWMMGYK